jgi:hypothetical protein
MRVCGDPLGGANLPSSLLDMHLRTELFIVVAFGETTVLCPTADETTLANDLLVWDKDRKAGVSWEDWKAGDSGAECPLIV